MPESLEIQMDDLEEDCQLIAHMIGMDKFIELAHKVGGQSVYIPKPERILRLSRDRRILKEFNGRNYGQLAQKYKLTETWIREIIKKGRIKP